MRLGAPVTALSLSPSMEMLATAHASARGIYLWSNQLLFGGASAILPSRVLTRSRCTCSPILSWLTAFQQHFHG